ncbi:hypothetical protein OUZ56_012015 [Daphnia magna]|uniref:Uncharacterized protein n=1 Tax=Daphnia magna TaxID=35525 RepID=A0ABQ9Z1S3_9CRUS|nr:hypothetical protein OUZ56_012015 [Daphnia magna]
MYNAYADMPHVAMYQLAPTRSNVLEYYTLRHSASTRRGEEVTYGGKSDIARSIRRVSSETRVYLLPMVFLRTVSLDGMQSRNTDFGLMEKPGAFISARNEQCPAICRVPDMAVTAVKKMT